MRIIPLLLKKIFLCAVLACACLLQAADLYKDPAAEPQARLKDLLGKMTLEEKIAMLGGTRDTCIPGNTRLGIPMILMSDGPHGIRAPAGDQSVKGAALPVEMLLGATFDADLAYRYGETLAQEAKANGIHLMLAPGVNLYRYPICGRNFEYLGEDPFLTGVLGAELVKGMQAHNVGTSLKHYAANNQEFFRWSTSSDMDERTLHEIYLAAFERPVKEADPATVMAGLNPVNGVLCIENDYLNNRVLKGKWGYKGAVVSDWSGTRDALRAAKGGLDLEMPRAKHMNLKNMTALLEAGEISEALIDDKVSRILRMYFRFGWLDRPALDSSIPKDNPASDAFALEAARKGITLLKNEKDLLPLDASKIKQIVVMGPNSNRTPYGGDGSSNVRTYHAVTFLDGIKEAVGANVQVTHIDYPKPPHYVKDKNFASPIKLELYKAEFYSANTKPQGEPILVKEYEMIDYLWTQNKAFDESIPRHGWMAFARWTTTIRPEKTGEYLFVVDMANRQKYSIFLDDKQVLPRMTQGNYAVPVQLKGGQTYKLRIEGEIRHGGRFRFGWGPAVDLLTKEQRDTITKADAVIACMGFKTITSEGEDSDRSYALTDRQDQLINEVAALNKKTIVVLNVGGSVRTDNWIQNTPALIHAWYAGQQGGTALADILFGKVNPSGRLPITWEKRIEDSPAFGNYPTDLDPENNVYREGIFMGYRGFDKKNVEPLFPFGFGLSYTTFQLSNASMELDDDGETWSVKVDVTNAGKRDGETVVQGYLKAPSTPEIKRPVRELKTFKRVHVPAGKTVTLTLPLKRADLGYYDTFSHGWRVVPGDYDLQLGLHSRDEAMMIPFEIPDDRSPDGI